MGSIIIFHRRRVRWSTGFPHGYRHKKTLAEVGSEALDGTREQGIMGQGVGYFSAGVEDGRVVPSAEVVADLDEGQCCKLSREVHPDLARQEDFSASTLGAEGAGIDAIVFADAGGDLVDGQRATIGLVVEGRLEVGDIDAMAEDRRQAFDARQSSLELADASGGVLGDPVDDRGGQRQAERRRALAEVGRSARRGERVDADDQPLSESAREPNGQAGELSRAFGRGDDERTPTREAAVDEHHHRLDRSLGEVLDVLDEDDIRIAPDGGRVRLGVTHLAGRQRGDGEIEARMADASGEAVEQP